MVCVVRSFHTTFLRSKFTPCSLYFFQVVVNDVHIRYEEPEADAAHPFALGILLENLSAQSTDQYWVSGCAYLLDLQNFVVYSHFLFIFLFDGEILIVKFMVYVGHKACLHEHQVPNPDSQIRIWITNPHGRDSLSLDLNPVCLHVNTNHQDLSRSKSPCV